jgi:hypothetical protein
MKYRLSRFIASPPVAVCAALLLLLLVSATAGWHLARYGVPPPQGVFVESSALDQAEIAELAKFREEYIATDNEVEKARIRKRVRREVIKCPPPESGIPRDLREFCLASRHW